ncbi:MAG: ATP-binding protein, partial [Pyramidobacter sp.]|nr:ATP-binding protein [Pyramidobacter sp.]
MIPRERYMERIRPFIGSELIKVVTGIRRCGKSVMLELIKDELRTRGVPDERIISFNFEQLANAPLCTATALHAELSRHMAGQKGKFYLFFDEIQEVAAWEKCVNSCRVDFDCDIYITGSNARLLSGELATYLGGRYVDFVLYPFSFEEFLLARQQKEPQTDATRAFQDYIELGGMPSLTQLSGSSEVAVQFLKDLYNSILLKDVVRRNKIRDVDLLERVVTFVLAGVGHPFSAASISKYFKSERRSVSHDTIMNYVKACADAFLFYKVPREDLIGKNILSISEKYYVADHGLREAVYGENARD